jgi:hypothetical protein
MFNRISKRLGKLFLKKYKIRVQRNFNASLDHCLDTAREMLNKSKYCFLISNSERKWPSARVVQPSHATKNKGNSRKPICYNCFWERIRKR